MDSKTRRAASGPLTREEVITEFRLMAADAERRGYTTFQDGWTRAANLLEAGEPLESVIEPVANDGVVEPDPNQLTFGFDDDGPEGVAL